jgi:hypothetical protein
MRKDSSPPGRGQGVGSGPQCVISESWKGAWRGREKARRIGANTVETNEQFSLESAAPHPHSLSPSEGEREAEAKRHGSSDFLPIANVEEPGKRSSSPARTGPRIWPSRSMFEVPRTGISTKQSGIGTRTSEFVASISEVGTSLFQIRTGMIGFAASTSGIRTSVFQFGA